MQPYLRNSEHRRRLGNAEVSLAPCGMFRFAQHRRRLGIAQVNLALLSACTMFRSLRSRNIGFGSAMSKHALHCFALFSAHSCSDSPLSQQGFRLNNVQINLTLLSPCAMFHGLFIEGLWPPKNEKLLVCVRA